MATKNDPKLPAPIPGVSKPVSPPSLEIPFDKMPHKSLHDFIMAKETIKLVYRFPEMDVARSGPEMDLIFRKREVGEAGRHLQKVRKYAQNERKKFEEEVNEVKCRNLELRQDFLRFNKFIYENHEKRGRTVGMIKAEEAKHLYLNKELDEAKIKINYYNEVIIALKKAIEKYDIYKVFMKDVAANSSYENVSDILKHYQAMAKARENVSALHKTQVEDLNRIRDEFRLLKAQKMPELVKYNVKMHNLRRIHARSKKITEFWQTKINTMKEIVHMSYNDLSIIQACCWDIHCYLAHKRELPITIKKSETCKQLVFIKAAILEHKEIVKLARELTEKESHSDIVTRGSVVASNSVVSSENLVKLYPTIVNNTD